MKQIQIEQWPHVLETGKDTVLDTALAAGVPYPHQCRSGECGECKTRVLSGEIQQYPCLAGTLSEAERAEGIVLACRSRPKTHIKVRWLADENQISFPRRKLNARVRGIEQVSRSVMHLSLEHQEEPMDFAAGQYLRLKIGDLPARSYSMANRPGSDTN